MDEVIASPTDFSIERNRRLSTLDTMIHHTEDEWLKIQDAIWKMELE